MEHRLILVNRNLLARIRNSKEILVAKRGKDGSNVLEICVKDENL